MKYNNKVIGKSSVQTNFIYNIAFQIIILFVPLVTTPYISRVLGAENVGEYSFSTSIVTYFTIIATFGSAIYGQRSIAYNRDNKENLSKVFWNIVLFRCIMAILGAFFYFLYIGIMGSITKINIVIALNIVNVAIDISWFYQGLEKIKYTVTRSIFVKVISFACVFLFVRSQDDTWKYALIISGSIVLGNFVLWKQIPVLIDKPKILHPFEGIKDMLFVFLPTIATQVYMVLDKSMIGWITNSNYANACYEQSEKLARAAITIVTSIGAVILPRVAYLYNKGKVSESRKYVYLSYRIIWALAFPLVLGMSVVSSHFIPVYLGNGYELSINLLCIFSFLILSVSLAYVTGISYLIPTQQQNVYTLSVTISAIVNFSLNIFLIRYFGAIGAAISSVVSETLGTLIQIVYCIKKGQLSVSGIFGTAWKYLLSSFVMFCVLLILKKYVEVSSRGIILLVGLGIGLYIFLLFILRDELFMSLLKKIENKLCNKK